MKARPRHVVRHSPRVECLERRELLSVARVAWTKTHVASLGRNGTVPVAVAGVHATAPVNRPIMAAAASPSTATFNDPTAVLRNPRAITIGIQDYVAPFATLN